MFKEIHISPHFSPFLLFLCSVTVHYCILYSPGLDEGAPGSLQHPPGGAPRVPPPQHQTLGGGRPEQARSILSSRAGGIELKKIQLLILNVVLYNECTFNF